LLPTPPLAPVQLLEEMRVGGMQGKSNLS
jgi:hypothetical protein